MSLSEPFTRLLAENRSYCNAQVAQAKHRYPGLDTEAFSVFLKTSVDVVVSAVHTCLPERSQEIGLIAYGMALELVAQSLAGPAARNQWVDRVWQELVPNYAQLMAHNPRLVLATLTNAILNIEKVSGVHIEQWLQEMKRLAQYVDSVEKLQHLGKVLAWRSGAAYFREAALAAASQLSPTLALAAVGASSDSDWTVVKDQFLANRWWSPEKTKAELALQGIVVGQFTGFGGIFELPPQVQACEEGFFVKSADRYSFLMADVYGAVLQPASQEEFEGARAIDATGLLPPRLEGSRLLLKWGEVLLNLPQKNLSFAYNFHTVAVTSPYTHAIWLFPLQAA
ncbi:MAG: hypothetical protein K1X48_10870 [Burkholderiaceae bacterium]|nr:hypothetical protein [Burkholderiaceae bacterium]